MLSTADETLERLAERPRILVVGLGGAGCETMADMEAAGLPESIDVLSINTDGMHLKGLKVKHRMLVGEMQLHGRGGGADIARVKSALEGEEERFKELFRKYHLVFVIAGLGGGTGSAMLPFCVSLCREVGALCVPVAILPFEVELESNSLRRDNARATLKALITLGGILLVLSNEKLRRFDSEPLRSVFRMRSTYLRELVLSVVDMVDHPSEINVDLGHVRRLIEEAGLSTLMVAEGHYSDPEALVRQAIEESFLDFEIVSPGPVLLHMEGGSNLSLRTHHNILEAFRAGLHHPREFTFGTRIRDERSEVVRVTAIMGQIGATAVNRLLSQRIGSGAPN